MPWDVWGRIPKSLRVRIKPVSTKLMHVRMIPGTDELATSTYNDEYTPLSIPRQHLRVRWMDLYIMNIEKNRGPLSSQLILRTARTEQGWTGRPTGKRWLRYRMESASRPGLILRNSLTT